MTQKQVIERLEALEFEALIGLPECVWLDAKETPYHLDSPKQKLELAKDVTALANASGGLILLGFDTIRHPTTAAEEISRVCPFSLSLVNPDRYSKVLATMVHPAPHAVRIALFESGEGDGRGIAVIVVDPAQVAEKPYIVGGMLDANDQRLGAYFGYFERKHDVIPPVSIARIQQQLSAGLHWSSIDQRLQAIEANIVTWGNTGPRTKDLGITDKTRGERLRAACIAVGRHDLPLAYYVATAEGQCDFPTLFRSRSERVVRLIEKPPQLRAHGFEIWAGDASEIVEGRLRRNMIAGHRLIELWKDGLFIHIAPGDEDYLGWRTSGADRPIHINNFVLAESVLAFCWLMKFVFDEADPRPPVLRLSIGFDNLKRLSGTPTLTTTPEGRMQVFPIVRPAPAGAVEVFQLAETGDYDPERLGYLLLADIYNWFGFDSTSMPYVDSSGPRPLLKATAILGNPLPTSVPTPEMF